MGQRLFKTIPVLLAFFCVHFLVSCQHKGATPTGEITFDGGTGGQGPRTSSMDGTSDQGGGGNLIKGKPIDFYAKDITTWSEYKTYIEPIDRAISKTLDSGGVSMLRALARSKTWYLIPVPLDKLPKERIGTNFDSTQGAYQTEREVFITEVEYGPRESEKDHREIEVNPEQAEKRAMLLLHELVMAWYRVKFKDMSIYCEAMDKQNDRAQCLSGLAKENQNKLLQPKSQDVFLTAEDYESIRHVTNWLYDNYKNLDRATLFEKLIEKKFDERMYNASSLHSAKGERAEQRPVVTREQILEVLEAQFKTGHLPRYCDFATETPLSAKKECELSFRFDGDSLILHISADDRPYTPINRRMILEFSEANRATQGSSGISLRRRIYRNGLMYRTFEMIEKRPPESEFQVSVEFLLGFTGPNDFSIEGLVIKRRFKRLIGQTPNGRSYRFEDVRPNRVDEVIRFIHIDVSPAISPGEI